MIALQQDIGSFYRAPARVVAAQTEEELLELLSITLRGLYRKPLRYELYAGGEGNKLLPVPGLGNGASGTKLLASLKSRLLMRKGRGPVAESHLFPALHGLKRGSLMSAPLLDGRALIGLIVVEAPPETFDFTSYDLDVLEGVAALFSMALQRVRSERTEGVRASVDLDRRSASKVQRRLMSETLPAGIGVTVDAKYLPALDVGGDFYELAYLGDGKIGGAIGDVSGKGVSAALIMSRVSSDVRRALRSGVSPSTVLMNVNATLADVESETFVTASCIRLDARRRKLTVANAGHLPLVVRRAGGEVFSCGPASGTPLGLMPCDYTDDEVDLESKDIVLLMTDGLVEALDRPSDRMGGELLRRLLQSAPPDPKVINALILEAANEMKGSKPLDDVTLVALQLA
jgi:serine phosphatase RsbU (regulator of sigma subunit)